MSAPRRAADTERRQYLAALLLVLAVVAISYVAFAQPRLGGTYELKAVVSNANQLRSGSPVRIAGVDVGQVMGVDRGPGNTSTLRLRVEDRGLPLHKDATLKIRPRLFLEGGYYVDLKSGSPSAPKLDSGSTLPLPQTAVPVQLNDLLSSLDRPARASFTGLVQELHTGLSDGGAQSLRRTSRQLPGVLRDLAWVAKAAQGTQPHDVSELVANGAKVTGALASRDVQLAGLVTGLDRSARALSDGDALGRSVAALDRVARQAPAALDGVDRTLPSIRRFATAIRPGFDDAPQQLRQISTAVRQLGSLVAPGQRDRVLGALRTTFEDLPNLVSGLGALFPVTRPVVSCLGTHITPTLQAEVPDGKLSTGQPAWLELAHALVGFSSISQNFDGNGYQVRYGAGISPDGVSLSDAPGIGPIVANGPKVLGSRPSWFGAGVAPEYRPDAKCADQPVPDLSATTRTVRSRQVRVQRARLGESALRKLLQPQRLRRALGVRP